MKALSYEELRALYKKFLHSQDISKATINTAYVDTFYLWRKESKELFWDVLATTDFEKEANFRTNKTVILFSPRDNSIVPCELR